MPRTPPWRRIISAIPAALSSYPFNFSPDQIPYRRVLPPSSSPRRPVGTNGSVLGKDSRASGISLCFLPGSLAFLSLARFRRHTVVQRAVECAAAMCSRLPIAARSARTAVGRRFASHPKLGSAPDQAAEWISARRLSSSTPISF